MFFLEYEIYLIFLTLGSPAVFFCRCLVRAMVVAVSADPIALRKVRLWPTPLRALPIQMMSTTPWRTFALVLIVPSPGTCRQSSMPRLLVLLLVRPDLLLGRALSLVVVLGLLAHLADLPRRRLVFLLPDRRGRDLIVLLLLWILYRRITLHQNFDILLEEVFDRAILSLLWWRICLF